MQNPASAILSLLTCLVHAAGAIVYFRACRRRPAPYSRWVWAVVAVTQVFAWLWSFIFHVRETWLSERCDYMCVVVVCGLLLPLVAMVV